MNLELRPAKAAPVAEAWNGICDCPKYPKTHPAHLSGGSVSTPGKTHD